MAEPGLQPRSALDGAVPGRSGVPEGKPGIWLRERVGCSVVSIAARRGRGAAVAAAIEAGWGVALPGVPRAVSGGGVDFLWCGAGQWLAVAPPGVGLEGALRAACGDAASLAAQGDGRALLRLGGPAVREVLASLVAIDLHPRAFRPGDTAITLLNHVAVQLTLLDMATEFELMAPRSYAPGVLDALLEAGARFGAELLPPA